MYPPVVLVDDQGHLHAFWGADSDGDSDLESLYYALLKAGVWTEPVDILYRDAGAFLRAGEYTVRMDVIATQQGSLLLVLGNGSLECYRSDVHTASRVSSWEKLWCPNDTVLSVALAQAPQGTIYLVYVSRDNVLMQVSSTDDGETWSNPLVIARSSSAETVLDTVDLDIDANGVMHIVWSETEGKAPWPPAHVYYSASRDGGATWKWPVKLSDANRAWNPRVLAQNPEIIHVSWTSSVTDSGKYYTYSRNGGASWQQPVRFQTNTGLYHYVQMAVGHDDVLYLVLPNSLPPGDLIGTFREGRMENPFRPLVLPLSPVWLPEYIVAGSALVPSDGGALHLVYRGGMDYRITGHGIDKIYYSCLGCPTAEQTTSPTPAMPLTTEHVLSIQSPPIVPTPLPTPVPPAATLAPSSVSVSDSPVAPIGAGSAAALAAVLVAVAIHRRRRIR